MSNSDKKLVLLAGIVAAGIFSAAFASTQFLSANAQSTNGTSDDESPMPVDIGCPTGAEVCEDDISEARATVSTSGTATTKVQPDKFSVTVGVETNGTTAQEAADKIKAEIVPVVTEQVTGSGENAQFTFEECLAILPGMETDAAPPDASTSSSAM